MVIIDRQLPFEYTITNRKTDVVVVAHPIQNINHSAFRSISEREKLSGNNFNDGFRQLKLVLRVEKKKYVTEQPLPATADSATNACKQEEGKLVAAYVIKMKGYVDQLERLGYVLPQDLIVGLILNGLTKYFTGFVRNNKMHNMEKTIGKLHAMLIEYEKGLPKKAETPEVMMIKGDHPANDDTCHHCKDEGNWKRNCHVYLAELLKKKKQVGSASSSDNFHYAPFITRGVVLFHPLVENGFVQCFTDYEMSVSKNNVFYFNVIPSNGIYEIDMHDLVSNVNSIYNVSTKRAKHNLDFTYLWHCRLTHISKKRIEKLQQKGLLRSTNNESFDQCVSCLLGKMTRKSFSYRPKRATDLLGIIHTDVCCPLRHVSRQGASYFITFTDDYSRYGYVYLLKHKHEVFETFKVFKNEVENQLGKIIKSLRSDRGGEYIIQEFKIILKLVELSNSLFLYTHHNTMACLKESTTRILNMVPTKKVDKTLYELWYEKVPNLSYLKVWGCEALVERDTPEKLQQRSVKCIFIGYSKETIGYYFYFPPENKIVVARYAEFFEKNLITQEVSGRALDLEEIQNEDTLPSEITSEIPMEVEGFESPQEEVILIRRSERTHQAPNHLCLNVEVDEHILGDVNEPASYKATMLDS
uniref:Integrase catalytic domain-containing protein n=1 Tax=Tanacetum cinerariifolium TaxID=118510 RepID=A0A6L2MQH0_TANCI|nr:hypothetical protein [Tanacetum cinerariifolium]